VLVGDREGVVVIPRHLADEVARQGREQTRFEDFVTERVLAGQSTFGLYPPNGETLAQFEQWKARR
jgi:regulator of RNase E activity RraA